MRVLTASLTALAITALAATPGMACEWAKTAKAKSNMTVAKTAEVPDIAIATNDLPQTIIETVPGTPAPKAPSAE